MDTDEGNGAPKLSPEADRELTRLWRTWRTVLEMLVDRGYAISEPEMKISREQFRQRFGDRETGEADRRLMRLSASPTEEMNLLHTPIPTKSNPNPQTTAGTIWVEFSPETTIGIKHLRQFAHHLDQQKYTTGIFITIGPVTTAAMRAFEPLSQVGITAEHFQESDLLVNITRHELVPRHVLLSAEEKKVLLQRYRLKETQLPRIQHSDPVSRYLGLKRGNVVKIIRKSETAGSKYKHISLQNFLLILRMGRRGGNRGGRSRGGFGRGGGGPHRGQRERTNKAEIDRHNAKYEQYYNELDIVPKDQEEEFWEAFRRDLPNSFRFTGSKGHALAVQQRLKEYYIPKITSITYEGQVVETPQAVPWYPDQLAWFMTTPKNVIRRFPPFASFQKFLVAESDVGNISRQEVVSMIPPLVIDLKPGMTVLDLCAAPGSKSAQLIEMVHGGEEERTREVAADLANGLDRPAGDDYADDGRSTGLLIANDVDYKRAHMLVHQMKRLSSPNIIVTNHDATIFPSIKLPSELSEDGKVVPNRYLKFDRILADVPCSGDGTSRKNIEIWRNWNPSNALGLHITQVRILVRALQMLKVGGRVVYSTCSMNPVEDEAVLAHAIDRCGGQDIVQILDTSKLLPGLKRYPGLRSWKVMDKAGRVWHSHQEVEDHRTRHGDEGLNRLQDSMFPPQNDLPLERCMRVYPYQQDTGAFFIAILEKRTEIKVRAEEKAKVSALPDKVEAVDVTRDSTAAQRIVNGTMNTEQSNGIQGTSDTATSPLKRKREDDDDSTLNKKLIKSEENGIAGEVEHPSTLSPREHRSPEVVDAPMIKGVEVKSEVSQVDLDAPDIKIEDHDLSNSIPADSSGARPEAQQQSGLPYKNKRKNGQPFEEPFKYLDPDIDELEVIRKFYNISPRFPRDRFMVRNAIGTATKNIYYTTSLAKSILQENEGKGMKFVHSGVKMFVKQDVPSPEVCPWRIQTDGLAILEAWVGPVRIVKLTKRETLRKLLIEMFPRFHGDDWKNLGEIGEQIRDIGMGCCVLRVEPTNAEDGLSERMVFPLWKSLHSLNLMLPKEERKALLLRLFNDETPLVNLTQKQKNATFPKVEPNLEETESPLVGRNSSSPEGGVSLLDAVEEAIRQEDEAQGPDE